jgi:three-Cys-motif partner protein
MIPRLEETMSAARPVAGEPHRFGGNWTSAKLAVLAAYLDAYSTALSRQPFQRWYIDAFAGSGSRLPAGEAGDTEDGEDLFGAREPRELLDGSARVALKSLPAFDHFVFIERSPSRCAELRALPAEFGLPPDRVDVLQEEANAALDRILRGDWSRRRAVLLLDPYGMQVEWRTIQAVARTRAIDLWVLFPLMAVARVLARSGDIPESWRRRVDLMLGTREWYERIYAVKAEPTLFGVEQQRSRAGAGVIGELFHERLRAQFPGVARRPALLKNSTNSPLYLLHFAAANERGAKVALRIAELLLKGMS